MVSFNGFASLEQSKPRSNGGGFSKLNALKTLRISPTPPDNKVNVRFLYEGFAELYVHKWVDVGGGKRINALCVKDFRDKNPKSCVFCETKVDGEPVSKASMSGVNLVAILDEKDQPLYEEITDASASDYDSYAAVMSEENIVKNGDTLTLLNVPQIRIADFGRSFWEKMKMFNEKYSSICDRSYTVYRNGAGLDTVYHVAPSDKDPEYKSPELLQMSFEPGLEFCMSVEDYCKFLSRDKLTQSFVDHYNPGSNSAGNDNTGSETLSIANLVG